MGAVFLHRSPTSRARNGSLANLAGKSTLPEGLHPLQADSFMLIGSLNLLAQHSEKPHFSILTHPALSLWCFGKMLTLYGDLFRTQNSLIYQFYRLRKLHIVYCILSVKLFE
jgi:hypothetical protein